MNDLSYDNWNSMSDKAIAEHIGQFIKHNRIQKNKTQEDTAKEAGISRSTLSLLERGETVTLSTLLRVLRVLDLLDFMDSFKIQTTISPIALAKIEKKKRKRARNINENELIGDKW